MYELVYASEAVAGLTQNDIEDILSCANARNPALGITGLMIFDGKRFLQLLEGPFDSVETIFASIERDPRHTDIIRYYGQNVATRSFDSWSMGFKSVDSAKAYEEVARMEGRSLNLSAADLPSMGGRLLRLLHDADE
ncbi:BLUF domain-containing protein [Pseudahrensia aquimaris]|uniref:BLUF domain-containing protein n=1 Tax=Pseudahrensia aquimaris TaxID=744461 RepID=A0ABW3FGC8_9HYPH